MSVHAAQDPEFGFIMVEINTVKGLNPGVTVDRVV